MRVIAGTAGGLRLQCPNGIARPMMDRVRGAVFSSLGEVVIEARVLDLFSGSGALGIEALSRGAASCTFVDSHPKSIDAIRANLAHARLHGEVRRQDVAKFMATANEGSFDLAFADPPFALEEENPAHPVSLLNGDNFARVIRSGGYFAVELPIEPPKGNSAWELLRCRRYGQAWVAIYQRKNDK